MAVTILTHATLVNFNPAEVRRDVDIVITDDTITQIGEALSKSVPSDRILDIKGAIVHPGMVCSHHHYYSGLSRGILANIPPSPDFISTLQNLWWRVDRALGKEAVYLSSAICSIDAIKSGTTSVVDHHASPTCIEGSLSEIKRGFELCGLRGMTCYEVTDRNGGQTELEAGIEENLRFCREVEADRTSTGGRHLVEAAIGAHAPFTVSDEGMRMLSQAVSTTGKGLHIHLAEDAYDLSWSHHHYRLDLIDRLERFGLIDQKSILVHGLYLNEREISIINSHDAFLAHNARSNMNNHVGYNEKLPSYKNLLFGTDGLGADMFEEFKFAFFKHRDAGGPWWPAEFLEALMRGNELLSRYFGASFGRIAEGYKADLVISDYEPPTPLTEENLAGHLAFGMGSGSVRSVMVDGKLVMEDRKFPFDTTEIYAAATEEARKVWKRVDSLT